MDATEPLQTWHVLKELGFTADHQVISDVSPGLSFDFGSFKLTASCVTSPRSLNVVLFGGIFASGRTLAEVTFEMPRQVDSWEQCAAWIAWGLEQCLGAELQSARHVHWLEIGWENRSHLPWLRDRVAYEARPLCSVERAWARAILRDLRSALLAVPPESDVTFAFDGEVLKICCGDKVIAGAATGKAWPYRYRLKAGRLKNLPRRLLRPEVSFSVWRNDFQIGNVKYAKAISNLPPSERAI